MLRADEWKPPNRISAVIRMARALLTEPNADDAVETRIADEFRNDRKAYEKSARDWVSLSFLSGEEVLRRNCGRTDNGKNRQRDMLLGSEAHDPKTVRTMWERDLHTTGQNGFSENKKSTDQRIFLDVRRRARC